MTKVLRYLGVSVAVLALIAIGVWWAFLRPDIAQLPVEAVSGPRPKITAPREQAFPTIAIAEPIGWRGNAMPIPAEGLTVSAFARDLDHPRWLYALPNGDVLVAESNSPPREIKGVTDLVASWLFKKAGAGVPSANRISLLRDADGDGVAELKTPFITGLNSPFGMALVGDQLYVANHDALMAFPYSDGQTAISSKGNKVVDLPGGGNHWTKSLVASPDNQRLYIGVGSTSNIGENGMDVEVNRANILELDLAKKRLRIFTAGLRNPVGMAWEPVRGNLWTVVNERDMLGSDLAPDYLARADFGGFYGWPYTYWGGYEDARVEQRPEMREYTKRPDYALGPHTASLGLAFGSLGSFTNGAFIGQHGSWNRKPPSGYKVVFVPFTATGFPQGAMRDVLTGFLTAKGEAQGRPVGVITDRRGGLLVADDVGNRVWRVSAQ
ncbi:MAG: PQQ-dependent sugar dehydrogenase [Sphingomonadaceae bacterium]